MKGSHYGMQLLEEGAADRLREVGSARRRSGRPALRRDEDPRLGVGSAALRRSASLALIMAAPRLERADLVDMASAPGECYPYEIDVENGRQRLLRCGCTPTLDHPWPHS